MVAITICATRMQRGLLKFADKDARSQLRTSRQGTTASIMFALPGRTFPEPMHQRAGAREREMGDDDEADGSQANNDTLVKDLVV